MSPKPSHRRCHSSSKNGSFMLKFSLPTAWSRSPFPLSALQAADFPSPWESPSFLAVSSLSPPSCCPSPTMGSSETLPPPLLPDLHSAPVGFHPLCASSKGTQDTHLTVQASSKLLLIHPAIQPMFIACLLPGTALTAAAAKELLSQS